MMLAHAALSYYFFALDQNNLWGPPWLAIAGLATFIVGFSLALGPIPWLIVAELFPTEVQSLASSLATAANWFFSFLVCYFFQTFEKAITKEGAFLGFAIVCGILFVFVLILVPETKGKTVEEVLTLLSTHSARSLETR